MQGRSRSRLWLGASLLLPLLVLAIGLWLEWGGLVDTRRAEENQRALEMLGKIRAVFVQKKTAMLLLPETPRIRVDDQGRPRSPFLLRQPDVPAPPRAPLSAAGRIGLELEGQQQAAKALPFLELASREDPDSRLLLARARCLAKLGRLEEALTLLDSMMEGPGRSEPGFLLPSPVRAAGLAAHLLAETDRISDLRRIQQRIYDFEIPVPIEGAESCDRFFSSLGISGLKRSRARYRCVARAWRQIEIHGVAQKDRMLPDGTVISAPIGQDIPVLDPERIASLLNASIAQAPARWQLAVARPSDPAGSGPKALARLDLTPLPLTLEARPLFLLDSRLVQILARGLMALALVGFVFGNLLVWRMLRREIELSRLRSDFIDLISHELRTPLTALSLKAEMLAHGEVRPDKVQRYQRGLKAEVDRLSLLVGEILDFARLEKGRAPLEKRPTSTRALLARGLGEARAALRLSGQRVRVDAARDLPLLEIDVELLARALRNLLENASKYAPAGSEIRIEVSFSDRGMRLTVGDEGPGIPRQDRERIFEPFIRGDNALGKPGSGLGLALVRQAVEAHGGDIRVEDVPSPGARFSMTLPLREVA